MFGMCLQIIAVNIVSAMLYYCYHLDEHRDNSTTAPRTSNITNMREQVFWITLLCIGAFMISALLLLRCFLQSLIQLFFEHLETKHGRAGSLSMSVLANSMANCLIQFAMSSLYGISLGLTITELTK